MKKLIIFITAISFFTFCKKKNETPALVPAPVNATPVNTSLQNGLGNYTNSLHGVMQAEKLTIPSFSITSYESRAAFNSITQPYSFYYMLGGIFVTTGVNSGVLKLNSTTLIYDLTELYVFLNHDGFYQIDPNDPASSYSTYCFQRLD
jgi:hypothetical protein